MVIKKSKEPTLAVEGESATNNKTEEIGSWDQVRFYNISPILP